MSLRLSSLLVSRIVPLASVLALSTSPLIAGAATPEELEARLQALIQQVDTLRAEVASLQQQRGSTRPQDAVVASVPVSTVRFQRSSRQALRCQRP